MRPVQQNPKHMIESTAGPVAFTTEVATGFDPHSQQTSRSQSYHTSTTRTGKQQLSLVGLDIASALDSGEKEWIKRQRKR